MKKRLDYLDIVRGICIIYMVAGHIGFNNTTFDHYIHAFHMPIFFLLSGYFYKEEKFLVKTIKLLRKIILPYTFFSILYIVINNKTFLGTHTGIRNDLLTVLKTNNINFPIAGALWFLTSFFFCNILFSIIEKIKKKEICIGLEFLIMLIGIYLFQKTNINLWWSINSSFVGVGLMKLGQFLKEKDRMDKLYLKNNILFFIIIVANTLIILKTPYVNMRTNTYPFFILFLFNVFLSLITYINVSKRIEKYEILVKEIKLLGKESIIPLCLNQFVILIFNKLIFDNLFSFFNTSSIIILRFLIFIVSTLALIILIKGINNTKLKYLFGKWEK